MSNNRTFFKNVKAGQMTLGDIFSEVTARHTPEQSARVMIAGTELTTPREAEMLAGWQKPFLFARFFCLCSAALILSYLFGRMFSHPGGYFLVLIGLPLLVPMTVLILAWEMNIPRDISIMEVLKIVVLGGITSLLVTMCLNWLFPNVEAMWAGLIEEPAKLIVIYVLLSRKNRKYILDGILLGMAVGTGFAIMETISYVMSSFTDGVIIGMLDQVYYLAQNGYSISQVLTVLSEEYASLYSAVFFAGVDAGLTTALVRAFNAIAGHGMYAALYGGGLMMAKGSEEIRLSHLLSFDHLKYFIISVLIHALNNSGITFGLPTFLGGMIHGVLVLKTVIGIACFLPLLRTGVNQVVEITAGLNGGRVTRAVNRAESGPPVPGDPVSMPQAGVAQLECVAGPDAGKTYYCRDGQSLSLGRTAGRCDIALPGCNNVSSLHCSVALNGSLIVVTDLGSTNGTYIGSQRLMPNQATPIADGTVVYLGSKSCAFRVSLR